MTKITGWAHIYIYIALRTYRQQDCTTRRRGEWKDEPLPPEGWNEACRTTPLIPSWVTRLPDSGRLITNLEFTCWTKRGVAVNSGASAWTNVCLRNASVSISWCRRSEVKLLTITCDGSNPRSNPPLHGEVCVAKPSHEVTHRTPQ